MNEHVRQKLREIIATYGRDVGDDSRRCRGFLLDFCGEHRREVHVLVSAVEERVVIDLLNSATHVPYDILEARLTRRLCDNRGYVEDLAAWSVQSWALALGVIAQVKSQPSPPRAPQQPTPPQQPAKPTRAAKPSGPASPALSTVVVAKSGGNYTSISEAIRQVASNTRILVRPGLYSEGLIINKRLEIIGDGPGEQIIVESSDADCVLMLTENATISNLTLRCIAGQKNKKYYAVDISQGCLVLTDCDISSNSLACVAIHGSATNPLLRQCKIHGGKQIGIFVYDKGSGRIEECDIFGNTLSGILIQEMGNPTIHACQVHDGEAGGIAIHTNGLGTIEACDIYANALAGISIKTGSNPVIQNCRIYSGKQGGVFEIGRAHV